MLLAVVIAVLLFGSIATWGLVVSALPRLHSTESLTARRQTAHPVRVLTVFGLAGFAVTFVAYTILLHLLGVADDGTGGFLLFMLVFLVSVAPLMAIAVAYGRKREGGAATHQRSDESA